MDRYQSTLTFIIIVIIIFMAFPSRATRAAKNLTMLMAAMPLGKLCQALIQYFKNKQAKH